MLLVLAATRAGAQALDPRAADDAGESDGLSDDLTFDGGLATARSADVSDVDAQSIEPRWSLACACTDAQLAHALAGAPALSTVIAATLRAAGLAHDPVPGWRTRSRWSALVPAITSRVGNSESWREITDSTVSRALSYDVRVSWRLERLIYDPNEPRFTTFDIHRRRERRRLIAVTTRAYLAWLQARAAAATVNDADANRADAPTGTTGGASRDDLRATPAGRRALRRLIEAQAAHAELDAMTDGWFSHALSNPARSR